MNYNTVYVGMDVHKTSFSLCCYTNKDEKPEHETKVAADYTQVVKYIEDMRLNYGEDAVFVCGYEAGCFGYTLFRNLARNNVNCKILAPSTMSVPGGKKRIKTDKRDAALIAKCMAKNECKFVHVPTEKDEEIKMYTRMREDHQNALKNIKKQILSFCILLGEIYLGSKTNWTQGHIQWLRKLELPAISRETLDEYLATYDYLTDKLDRIDKRIEEFANEPEYREKTKRLICIKGIKTYTALALITETSDFTRFPHAENYASFLGLIPGEDTSSNSRKVLSITKAGNSHLRKLLEEAAQSYTHGMPGRKSKLISKRQAGNETKVIEYADKANNRLRRKYLRMVMSGKSPNVAKTAVARELACFVWGMTTGHFERDIAAVCPGQGCIRTANAATALTSSILCDSN